MKLRLLGVYGPYPVADGCCSSYLVEDGDTAILLDFGSGAYSRLLRYLPLGKVDAVVLSHLHGDHTGDMTILRYALEQGQGKTPLPLFAPETAPFSSSVFETTAVQDGFETAVGSLKLTFYRVEHAATCMAVKVTDGAGHTLFYTGDTAYFPQLASYALGCDLLLADACVADEDDTKAQKNHMTARQVGVLARACGCKCAILTHLWGAGFDPAAMLQAANCDCAVLAEEGKQFEV